MAKDLPYFKFYSSEWNDGDITLEKMQAQGVFINICSYYWSRGCHLEHSKLLKRFEGWWFEVDDLIAAGIITVSRGMSKISFLDKQWAEREIKKATMKANGLKGGRPKKNPKLSDEKTKSFPEDNQTITNKEEKREEEKRKEKNKDLDNDFETFWADYPRKIGKGKARSSYETARKKASHDEIMRGVFISPRLKGDDPQFLPHAATWLNQESWTDEGESKTKTSMKGWTGL